MNDSEVLPDPAARQRPLSDRLDSWKKIAVYLKRDVSTVQRWERREGMPVHRHLHDKQGSVFAYRSELDDWWESRRQQLTQSAPSESPEPASEPPPGPAAVPARRPWSRAAIGAGLAVLLLAGALGWLALERATSSWNPLANAKFSRLPDFAGSEQAATISPNGRFVAFLGTRAGQVDAWLGEIGSDSYRNLTEGTLPELVNPSIRTLGFSADSSLVTVWTRHGDGTHPQDVSIYAAPTAGGALRPYLKDAAEFDWSRDGRRLVFHTTAPGDPLFIRDANGGAARLLYTATAGVHCHYPLWSADGRFIYFVRGVPPNNWDIWRIRPTGEDLERLTKHETRVTHPVMLDERTLVYLATDRDGSGPWIYGLDVEKPIPYRLTSGLETYSSLAGSADGARLVATTANPRSSLWRLHLAGPTASPEAPVLVAGNARTPRFGAGYLVYVSARGGTPGIWTLSDGTTREIWHDATATITGAPTVSPDGARIAFIADDGHRTRLWVMDRDGTNVTSVADSLKLEGDPAWSPDGRSIVAAAVHEGEPRLMRIPVSGGAPAAMVSEYSVDPVWSPDGRFLAYTGADVGTTLPVRGAAPDGRPYAIPSLMLTRGARRLAILKDPPALAVLRGDIGHKDLWALNLDGSGERQLTALPADFVVNDFDLATDGSELIVVRVESDSEMALIERARSALPVRQ